MKKAACLRRDFPSFHAASTPKPVRGTARPDRVAGPRRTAVGNDKVFRFPFLQQTNVVDRLSVVGFAPEKRSRALRSCDSICRRRASPAFELSCLYRSDTATYKFRRKRRVRADRSAAWPAETVNK